jgi:hypothetical protein
MMPDIDLKNVVMTVYIPAICHTFYIQAMIDDKASDADKAVFCRESIEAALSHASVQHEPDWSTLSIVDA